MGYIRSIVGIFVFSFVVAIYFGVNQTASIDLSWADETGALAIMQGPATDSSTTIVIVAKDPVVPSPRSPQGWAGS